MLSLHSRRRLAPLAALIVGTTTVAACQIDQDMFGACAPTAGAFGTDGTNVLVCRDGVWEPTMTADEFVRVASGERFEVAPLPTRVETTTSLAPQSSSTIPTSAAPTTSTTAAPTTTSTSTTTTSTTTTSTSTTTTSTTTTTTAAPAMTVSLSFYRQSTSCIIRFYVANATPNSTVTATYNGSGGTTYTATANASGWAQYEGPATVPGYSIGRVSVSDGNGKSATSNEQLCTPTV